jgi:serine/threonine protein kinase
MANTTSTWPALTTTFEASTARPSSSPALDFLAAVATVDLTHYNLSQLGLQSTLLQSMDERKVGQGGFGIVDRGITNEKRLVAVKRIRASVKDTRMEFGRQLQRISQELRILAHEPLRHHSNIVDLVGYCLTESPGTGNPFLGIVLEYSSLGHLKSFLKSNGEDLDTRVLMGLARQVATGLQMLHSCGICHGDVKTQNTLVFPDGDKWIVKISDFGESIVPPAEASTNVVEYSIGTPLLSAPEVRAYFTQSSTNECTIDDAMRTDVFSFGLLMWEVLKRGSSYFEHTWCHKVRDDADDYDIQEYIDALPHDGLLSIACDYIRNSVNEASLASILQNTMQMLLRDTPSERSKISDVSRSLNVNVKAG